MLAAVTYSLALALLLVYALHRLTLVATALRLYFRPRDRVIPVLPAQLPVVTVQLPLFNELYVAERVISAAAALHWPKELLEIQILDDSTDETSALCARKAAQLVALGYDISHLHRTDRTGYKAGALAAGLECARGELVLVLDADFVPRPDLLERTVPYFTDSGVGMVQVRWEHLNRSYSALTRVQALLLDGHFAVEQEVRARTGRFFNFNGTAGLWRRAAIDTAGGWECDTLTEDLDLSYRALLAGWRFEYVLDAGAPAELPVDMNGFKSQQYRWAKGSIQVARKLLPKVLRASVPWPVKVDAFFHLTQNVPYLLTLLLALALVPAMVLNDYHPVWLDAALAVGATGTLAAYCMWSQWRIRRANPVLVFLQIPAVIGLTAGICVNQARAVLEGLGGKPSEFVRTPKHGVQGRGRPAALGRYRGIRTLTPLAELALAANFGVALGIASLLGQWWAIPICGVFACGFAYVGVGSIRT